MPPKRGEGAAARAQAFLNAVKAMRKKYPESVEWSQPIFDTLQFVLKDVKSDWDFDWNGIRAEADKAALEASSPSSMPSEVVKAVEALDGILGKGSIFDDETGLWSNKFISKDEVLKILADSKGGQRA